MSQQRIKLYATYPHPCSYFKDREARTVFVDPQSPVDNRLYSELSRQGFRRSGSHIYRPDCAACQQCIASRIPVASFKGNRRQRRTLRRNQDLRVELRSQMAEEAYPLYQRYINQRHRDGDMYPPSREQFEQFLCDNIDSSRYACFYLADQLVAVAVLDVMQDGLSAIYTFFEPELPRRSLGVLAVLWQIEYCRQQQWPYLYLGYWIRDCEKMRYKTDYRPIELYISKRWVRLN